MIPVVLLDKTGPLNNESSRSTPNPREGGEFICSVIHTTTSPITILEWRLTGPEVPVGLSISNTGVISGIMEIFDNQTAIKNNSIPKVTSIDGQNWMSNGRYRGSTYTFNFTVELRYEYEVISTGLDDDGNPLPNEIIEDTVTSAVAITMVRNYDVDNFVFVKKYLEAGHKLMLDGVEYSISEMGEYIMKHPGPFGSVKG